MVVPSFRVTNDAYCHGQGNTDVLAAQSPVATTKSWAVFRLAPQDHGVLHGVRVVLLADGRGLEPQPFVEPPRRVVRGADFERGTGRTEPAPFRQDPPHQTRAESAPAVLGQDGDVVDVNLVHHEPERTEPRHR